MFPETGPVDATVVAGWRPCRGASKEKVCLSGLFPPPLSCVKVTTQLGLFMKLAEAEAVFNQALERSSPEERAAFLRAACGPDDAFREKVERLLAAHAGAPKFLATTVGTIALQRPVTEAAGTRIGRYKLLEQIGEGGMGVVYMAEQEEPVRRRVALKIIKLGMDTKQVVARFEAERQALALMDHPHIARVLDGGETESGRPYFVMELVQGVPITEFCDKAKLSVKDRLKLFMQVCQAIQSAHQKGIIHRDIKPSNVLITLHNGEPMPKVIDFGIAKATHQKLTEKTLFTNFATMIGTPAYMSPEQAFLSSMDVDTRSDIYSLGVLLYALLTGTTPFPEKRLRSLAYGEMQRVIREEEPERPSTRLSTMANQEKTLFAKSCGEELTSLSNALKGDLDWIVMKCLEKDRTRRYDTATGLAADLTRHLTNEPVVARPPSAAYRFQKAWGRHQAAIAVAALITLVLVAATVVSVWQATLAKQRLAESEAISKFLAEVFESPDPDRNSRTITVAEALGTAARKVDSDLAGHPARQAALRSTLANTYFSLGLIVEAIPLKEKARDYYLANSGPEHPNTITAMHELASLYWLMDRREEAFKLRAQVLPLSRKVNGPEDAQTLWSMADLASSYSALGHRDEAFKLRQEVLDLTRKVKGPEHSDTIGMMGNLANSYVDLGREGDAMKLREEVLRLRRKVHGPEHPLTLSAMANLAISYAGLGRLKDTVSLLEQGLEVSRKVNGPEHPRTIEMMMNLMNSYRQIGRLDEAIKLGDQVLLLSRKVNGPEHPTTIRILINQGDSCRQIGRLDEALTLGDQALQMSRKVNGLEHSDTLWSMESLGELYRRVGRLDESLELFDQILSLRRKVNGPEHHQTLKSIEDLAIASARSERWDRSLKLWEELVAVSRKLDGPEHSRMLNLSGRLAIAYYAVGRQDESIQFLQQLLALSQKALGPEHAETLDKMNLLAKAYYSTGRQPDAIALMRQIWMGAPNENTKEEKNSALLKLAAWCVGSGQDADYEATRHRAVEWAAGTKEAGRAAASAEASCLLPSNDAVLMAKALALARQALELGQTDPDLPSFRLALGLAEFRNGRYSDAEQTLTVAEETAARTSTMGARDGVQATARLVRAMSLFRQQRPEEARKLFREAEAILPPLAEGARESRLDGRPSTHVGLIARLVYKEARALLGEPAAAKP